MIRVTTPTFIFTLPFDTAEVEQYVVSFGQNNKKILDKTKGYGEMEGSEIRVTLSQEETKLFKATFPVQIQLRVLTKGGDSLATQIYQRPVGEVLNDCILQTGGE